MCRLDLLINLTRPLLDARNESGSCYAPLSVEDREPHRLRERVGPVDAMASVRSDVEPVAGTQQAHLGLVGKAQLGGAGEQKHAFAFRLVVPEPWRARLPQRDNPLDAQIGPGQQCRELFACTRVRQREEKVHDTLASTPATARCQPA
jgi:hypothetical protein